MGYTGSLIPLGCFLMKFSLGSVLQNICSGCVGGLLVIGVAHAAELQKGPRVVTANQFFLMDSAGNVRGKWGVLEDGSAAFGLSSSDKKYRCVLSAGEADCIVAANGPDGQSAGLVVDQKLGPMSAVKDGDKKQVMIGASEDDQSLVIKGAAASFRIEDESGMDRAVLGHIPIINTNSGISTTKPLSCITLLDESGHVTWQQH
jgi:hypothetical protein